MHAYILTEKHKSAQAENHASDVRLTHTMRETICSRKPATFITAISIHMDILVGGMVDSSILSWIMQVVSVQRRSRCATFDSW